MRHDVRLVRALSALRRLLGSRRWAPVTTGQELADFVAAQTAYVAQRSVIEYCRARTGLNWEKLALERQFLEHLEVCRWEAYAIVLAEVAELALIRLRRDRAADPQAYLPGLIAAGHAALVRHPVPGHRSTWTDAAEAIERHLARAVLAAPRPVHLLGLQSADAIFDLLPIHADLRPQDRDVALLRCARARGSAAGACQRRIGRSRALVPTVPMLGRRHSRALRPLLARLSSQQPRPTPARRNTASVVRRQCRPPHSPSSAASPWLAVRCQAWSPPGRR